MRVDNDGNRWRTGNPPSSNRQLKPPVEDSELDSLRQLAERASTREVVEAAIEMLGPKLAHRSEDDGYAVGATNAAGQMLSDCHDSSEHLRLTLAAIGIEARRWKGTTGADTAVQFTAAAHSFLTFFDDGEEMGIIHGDQISSHPGLPGNRIVVPVAWIEKHWTEVAEARRAEFPVKINELSQDVDPAALSARRLRWLGLIPQAADGLLVGVWTRPEHGERTLVMVEMGDVIAELPPATRLRLLDDYVLNYGATDAEEDDYIRGRVRSQLERTSSIISGVTRRIAVHSVDQTHFAKLMGRERTQDIVPTTEGEATSLAAELFMYLFAEDDVGKAREAQYATP